jgi:hypothetical protein
MLGCGGGGGGGGGISLASSTVSSIKSSFSSSSIAISGTLTWSHPRSRTNGNYLELEDIGGYEIRYKPLNNDNYQNITIVGNGTLSYKLDSVDPNSEVEIAVYDTMGLYSDFVSVTLQ